MNAFAHNLAVHWSRFVECEERSRTLVPFLTQKLGQCGDLEVIDLCAGIGCEVRALAAKGHRVVANEVDESLRSVGMKYCLREHVEVPWTSADWTELTNHFAAVRFAGAFLLGNSFCLLRSREERARAASQFAQIITHGGRLLVDERNFPYILRERGAILTGFFRYSRRVMYCGKAVTARPVSVSDELVVFEYRDTKSEAQIGQLEMYPFREGELVSLFASVGFDLVDTSFDLGLSDRDCCDFITYEFRRTA
jgi:SAM-dependent methyltransferase